MDRQLYTLNILIHIISKPVFIFGSRLFLYEVQVFNFFLSCNKL